MPYTNAGIQVQAQFRSAAADPQRRKQLAAVVAMVMGAKLLELLPLLFLASPDQKEKYKDINPEELTRYIFIPHPNGKDFLRFRVPEQMTGLATIINMMVMEYMKGADYKLEDYVAAGTSWVPEQVNITQGWRALFAWVPQPLMPSIEVGMNRKTWPRVRDLVPQGLQGDEPEFQSFPNTSKVAKVIGHQFNLSPIKIDHLIEGYMGRTSRYFMGKPDQWRQLVNPFLRRMYFTAGLRMERFWEASHANHQMYNSLKDDRRDFTDAEAAIIQHNEEIIKQTNARLKEYRQITDQDSKEAFNLKLDILDLIDMLNEDVPTKERKTRSQANDQSNLWY